MHFLFIKNPADYEFGIERQEYSEDIYLAFKEMALATGGLVETSANPMYAFKRTADDFENYYLLYYSPESY